MKTIRKAFNKGSIIFRKDTGLAPFTLLVAAVLSMTLVMRIIYI